MKEILYIVLEPFAEHEISYLAQAVTTDEMGPRTQPKYVNRIVAPTHDAVTSVGGMKVMPHYSFADAPHDYAALVLIGGYGWASEQARSVVPMVEEALKRQVPVGAICNAASWMAQHGFLNGVKHTGNGIDQLKQWGGANYTNASGYIAAQAVSDGGIVTANGTGHLEFAREMLLLLAVDDPAMIHRFYAFYNMGFTRLMAPQPRFRFNTVGLLTTDNAATVRFYTQVFGFTTDWDGVAPNVEMHLGDMRIILFPRADFEQMTNQKYAYPKGFNGTMELAIDVPSFADVDKEYAHAISLGAASVMAPVTEPWGQRTCYVADPDGNLIEINSFCQ